MNDKEALEHYRTRIEEAANDHVDKQYDNETDKSWGRLDFIAGAEFIQKDLEKKLAIAIEAIQFARMVASEAGLKGAVEDLNDYLKEIINKE